MFNFMYEIPAGHKRSLDVATIRQGKTRFFSVLMLAWGNIYSHMLGYDNEVLADTQHNSHSDIVLIFIKDIVIL